jgi:hypothetical protein
VDKEPISFPKVGVISGRYPASDFKSYINHRAYCSRHGYTYIYCNWPTGQKNRYLNKLEYLKEYIGLFDFVFWIDDDAFFIDLDVPLSKFLPRSNEFFSVCSSPTNRKIHTYISSGQLFLRCDATSKDFIDEVLSCDLDAVRKWWPSEMGFFTNGDQDSMIYLLHTDARFLNYSRYSFDAFNSRVEDLLNGDEVFVLHFTGSVRTKRKKLRLARRHLKRGPTLLTSGEEHKWNLLPKWRFLAQKVRHIMPKLSKF